MHEQYYQTNFDRLVCDIKNKPLVLFLGSGINEGLIPCWYDLLRQLLKKALYKVPQYNNLTTSKKREIINLIQNKSHFSVYEQASLVKQLLGNQYIPIIKDTIYHQYNINEPHGMTFTEAKLYTGEGKNKKPLTLIKKIAELSHSPYVHAVVTYNYDNILLKTLELSKRKAFVVCRYADQYPRSKDSLPIYHVHGYIPNDNKIPTLEESYIVLTLDEYFQNMLEPYSWQTTSQLHFLQNYTCLFIGLSLNDINMQRLLELANKNVPNNSVYIMKDSLFTKDMGLDKTVDNFLMKSYTSVMRSLGVRVVITGEGYASVTDKIQQLIEKLRGEK